MDPKFVLLGLLAIVAVAYLVLWFRIERSIPVKPGEPGSPDAARIGTGFFTNFLDTLGIGSFAITTAIFRAGRMVRDELIPGTMNAGHAIASITQSFIYIVIVEVSMLTLVLMIVAAVLGAWLGAGIVSGWPRRKVQIGMGLCLIGTATLMAMSQLGIGPGGGDALELTGIRLAIGVAGNFVLGALMAVGIGLYAPCLVLVSLLGMNPAAGFPIMMGSCAFLMPVAGLRFVKERAYDVRAAVGLALGAIPGVLLAAYIFTTLRIDYVRWLVVGVVVYTAIMMLRTAAVEAAAARAGRTRAAR